jgi:hypothetical protein
MLCCRLIKLFHLILLISGEGGCTRNIIFTCLTIGFISNAERKGLAIYFVNEAVGTTMWENKESCQMIFEKMFTSLAAYDKLNRHLFWLSCHVACS